MERHHEPVGEYALRSKGACVPLRPRKRLGDVLELHLVEVCTRSHKVRDEALQILLLEGSRSGGFRPDRVCVEAEKRLVVEWGAHVSRFARFRSVRQSLPLATSCCA